jgi:type VI secretion system protein ImpH
MVGSFVRGRHVWVDDGLFEMTPSTSLSASPNHSPSGESSALSEFIAEPSNFSLIQAIHLIQASQPKAPPIGHLGPPSIECLRIRPALSLAFPTSEIADCKSFVTSNGSTKFVLTTTPLGLYGANSPLPTYFTERLLREDEDGPMRAFVDLINHRLLSLLYRSFLKYRPILDIPDGGQGSHYERRAMCLLGIPDQLSEQIPGTFLLSFAGLLTTTARSADSLERLVRGYFAVDCTVDQCIPHWLNLPKEEQTRLGQANIRLGYQVVAGDRVRSSSTAYRLTLGPITWHMTDPFYVGGQKLKDMLALIAFFDQRHLHVIIDIIVDIEGIPNFTLGDNSLRLGRAAHCDGQHERLIRQTIYQTNITKG